MRRCPSKRTPMSPVQAPVSGHVGRADLDAVLVDDDGAVRQTRARRACRRRRMPSRRERASPRDRDRAVVFVRTCTDCRAVVERDLDPPRAVDGRRCWRCRSTSARAPAGPRWLHSSGWREGEVRLLVGAEARAVGPARRAEAAVGACGPAGNRCAYRSRLIAAKPPPLLVPVAAERAVRAVEVVQHRRWTGRRPMVTAEHVEGQAVDRALAVVGA